MNETEKEQILSRYDNYMKSYKTWWDNRDSNMEERRILQAEPDMIDKFIRIHELEHELQSDFVKMMESRLEFYRILKTMGFHYVKIVSFIEYKITRFEYGVKKTYDITR